VALTSAALRAQEGVLLGRVPAGKVRSLGIDPSTEATGLIVLGSADKTPRLLFEDTARAIEAAERLIHNATAEIRKSANLPDDLVAAMARDGRFACRGSPFAQRLGPLRTVHSGEYATPFAYWSFTRRGGGSRARC
jgi:hypothetical protein